MLKLAYNLYCTTTFVSLDGALYEVSWLELIEVHLVLTTVLLPAVDLPLYCYSIFLNAL
jgi:hypothetical protein